jgi:hypothetical protein
MLPLVPDKHRRRGFRRNEMPGVVRRITLAAVMTALPFLIFMLELTACSSRMAEDATLAPSVAPTAAATVGN